MKRAVSLFLFTVMILSAVLPASAKVGDVKGNIYATDIKAYINGVQVKAYNIGGRTCVPVEEVTSGYTYNNYFRSLLVSSFHPEKLKRYTEGSSSAKVGDVVGKVYETDIRTSFSDHILPSYNIGGRTCVAIEDIGRDNTFSQIGGKYIWDPVNRTISLEYMYDNRADVDSLLEAYGYDLEITDGNAVFTPSADIFPVHTTDLSGLSGENPAVPIKYSADGKETVIGYACTRTDGAFVLDENGVWSTIIYESAFNYYDTEAVESILRQKGVHRLDRDTVVSCLIAHTFVNDMERYDTADYTYLAFRTATPRGAFNPVYVVWSDGSYRRIDLLDICDGEPMKIELDRASDTAVFELNGGVTLVYDLIAGRFLTDMPSGVDEPWANNMNSRKAETVTDTMSVTDFDSRYLKYIAEHTDGNYMTSPLSFRYALGLLLAGAGGNTRTELLKALGVKSEDQWISFCLDFNGFTEYFKDDLERDKEMFRYEVEQGWISPDSSEPFRALRVANSVWKADWLTEDFKDGYRDSVSKNYAAEYRTFTPANAVQKINEWADTKTEHMINRLLPDNYPADNLAVVLMNALYFKDAWVEGFDAARTREMDFHAADGSISKKDFMNTEANFRYYEDGSTKLVILPMKGGVSMAFVLGSTEGLGEKISQARTEKVNVTIPKMDLETSFSNGELIDFLAEYGVSDAFGAGADFSGMLDYSVFVSDIIQKTRIKLDEGGVEAAAVTAILLEKGAYHMPEEKKEFTADRPFSFYIYTTCNDTTAIMFAGEIVE